MPSLVVTPSSSALRSESVALLEAHGWHAPAGGETGLDGLVVWALEHSDQDISAVTDDEWDRMIERSVVEPYAAVIGHLDALRAGRGKAVVVLVSVAAMWARAASATESIGARMSTWTGQMFAMQSVLEGIRVNVVAVGVDASVPPSGAAVGPSDIVPAIEYLLSAASGQCVGTVLSVDGGTLASGRSWLVRNA